MNTDKYIFMLEIGVRDYELDSEGIVNNAIYLHYLEHTRHAPNRQRQDAAHSKSAGNRAKRLER